MNLLLTCATDFLGRRLAVALHLKSGVKLTVAVRRRIEIPAAHSLEVQGLDANTNWSTALIN